jgi:hypothetical protein
MYCHRTEESWNWSIRIYKYAARINPGNGKVCPHYVKEESDVKQRLQAKPSHNLPLFPRIAKIT